MERPNATSIQLKRLDSVERDSSRDASNIRRGWTQAEAPVRARESHLRPVPAEVRAARRRRPRKTRLTVYLSVDVIETLRNIVFWTTGATLAGLVEESLREGIAVRERLNGGPFPRRLEELKGGRPRRVAPQAAER